MTFNFSLAPISPKTVDSNLAVHGPYVQTIYLLPPQGEALLWNGSPQPATWLMRGSGEMIHGTCIQPITVTYVALQGWLTDGSKAWHKKNNNRNLTSAINSLLMDLDNVPQEFMTFGRSFVGAGDIAYDIKCIRLQLKLTLIILWESGPVRPD